MTRISLDRIDDIGSIRLGPNDFVVVKIRDHLSREDAKAFEKYLRDDYFPLHRVLVLSGGVDLLVVRGEAED